MPGSGKTWATWTPSTRGSYWPEVSLGLQQASVLATTRDAKANATREEMGCMYVSCLLRKLTLGRRGCNRALSWVYRSTLRVLCHSQAKACTPCRGVSGFPLEKSAGVE